MWPLVALAVMAGAVLPLQALINAALGGQTAGPVFAGLVNFVVGTCIFVVAALTLRVPLPTGAQAASVPFWLWGGGVFGSFFVFTSAFVAPRLGTAALVGLVMAGQLVASLALDHFGVLHSAVPVTLTKAAGCLLLLAGAYLIIRP